MLTFFKLFHCTFTTKAPAVFTVITLATTHTTFGLSHDCVFIERNNKFVKANCLEWIKTSKEKFDLIFLDPPSFSNSKSMDGNFDIQRDHKYLIEKTMDLLDEGGTLIFSTNRRGFKFDTALEETYKVFTLGRKSLSRDFSRQRAPHQCWEITLTQPTKDD